MEFIDQFEKHYDYDCTYMRRMANSSPEGFKTFADFLPMGSFGKALAKEIIWTARISAMLTEDCGACVQLNIKMALEQGLSSELVQKIVKDPDSLKEELKDIYYYAKEVAEGGENYRDYYERVQTRHNEEELTELALAIASTKIYPTIKRALNEFKSCSLYDFTF